MLGSETHYNWKVVMYLKQSILCIKCRSEMIRVRERPHLQEVTPPLNVTIPLPNISQAGIFKGACVLCRTP